MLMAVVSMRVGLLMAVEVLTEVGKLMAVEV